jgi:hypothetical protein
MGGAIGAAMAVGAVIGIFLGWVITTLIYHAVAHTRR